MVQEYEIYFFNCLRYNFTRISHNVHVWVLCMYAKLSQMKHCLGWFYQACSVPLYCNVILFINAKSLSGTERKWYFSTLYVPSRLTHFSIICQFAPTHIPPIHVRSRTHCFSQPADTCILYNILVLKKSRNFGTFCVTLSLLQTAQKVCRNCLKKFAITFLLVWHNVSNSYLKCLALLNSGLTLTFIWKGSVVK